MGARKDVTTLAIHWTISLFSLIIFIGNIRYILSFSGPDFLGDKRLAIFYFFTAASLVTAYGSWVAGVPVNSFKTASIIIERIFPLFIILIDTTLYIFFK